jgi:hypothetical protein
LSNLNLSFSIFDLKSYLMIPKRVYSNFSGLDSSKASYSVANGRKHATESLKSVWDYFWCLEKTKPAGYSTTVVVLSCYRTLQTYARKLEALALKLSDGEEARILDEI